MLKKCASNELVEIGGLGGETTQHSAPPTLRPSAGSRVNLLGRQDLEMLWVEGHMHALCDPAASYKAMKGLINLKCM